MKRRRHIAIAGMMIMAIFWGASQHSSDNSTDTGIDFHQGTWQQVLEQAKKENKLVFLDLYASWCGPCKVLKSKTFPDTYVGQFFNANFINYAVDAEKGVGVELAKQYNITGYPTLLFVDGNGNLVVKTMGYHTPEQLIDVGKQVVNR
jgi:thioredoxin 1